MPYANKGLHFGHIGGVFVPADCYARFLRDRIGAPNVLFVSGTDCYGSPIDEGYRQLVQTGQAPATIQDYVRANHDLQVEALRRYHISLDIFEGSGLGRCYPIHSHVTEHIIRRLHAHGWLELDFSAQFFDEEAQMFLNGRQVLGTCPVPGCKSQQAYADECELGHQYRPEDLINPRSSVSDTTPILRQVANWYLKLPEFHRQLTDYVEHLHNDERSRAVVATTVAEFLVPPILYVKQEFLEDYQRLAASLPTHEYQPVEKGKASFELRFADLASRDKALELLEAAQIRLRSGKTLVPFRITGNAEWGIKAPIIEDLSDRTVWCWPESLWAPISFSRCWLENGGHDVETLNPTSIDRVQGTWQDFWLHDDAQIYQFIGQDNIYFYGVAQTALWHALNDSPLSPEDQELISEKYQLTNLIANYHLLFLDKKASSSGVIKPPTALELLNHYTAEQLRIHFLALGLNQKPVSFRPKELDPSADPSTPDPVLKESALLTNVFNRLARSCFYEAQNSFKGLLPVGDVVASLRDDAVATILAFEQAMYRTEFHSAVQIASDFIRRANKYWSCAIAEAHDVGEKRQETLVSSFYLLRVATVLMHPIVPVGCESIFSHLNLPVSAEDYFSWDNIFLGNEAFFSQADIATGGHQLTTLPPRFDFFSRGPASPSK
jgi:methionyl-tRNA synthetase